MAVIFPFKDIDTKQSWTPRVNYNDMGTELIHSLNSLACFSNRRTRTITRTAASFWETPHTAWSPSTAKE